MKSFIVTAVVSAVLMSGPALAEDMGSEEKSMPGMGTETTAPGLDFKQLDTDHNGVLTSAEVLGQAELTENWESVDTNADGQLSEEEFSAFKDNRLNDGSQSTESEAIEDGAIEDESTDQSNEPY